MDQIKTGKFIAEMRRKQALTQRQLAENLNISDKTVSKWECGNGMPEVSLMLPLCDALHINVNELLSGECLTDADYKKRAEKNMIDLVKENKENRKKFIVSIILGSICIVAVVSLVMLAAFLVVPTAVRIILLLFAVIVAAFGIGAACVLEREAGTFECPYCHERFLPSMGAYVKGYHTFTKRRLTCPACGKTGMCKHRITK